MENRNLVKIVSVIRLTADQVEVVECFNLGR